MGLACQQGITTLPDTWFRSFLGGDFHMLLLLRPVSQACRDFSNIPP